MKTNSAGALLFAIITAFVLTLVASTLVVLTTNQYKIIDSEVDRIRAYYRAQAGMEYAIWYAYTYGSLLPTTVGANITLSGVPDVTSITITKLPATGLSNHSINVRVDY